MDHQRGSPMVVLTVVIYLGERPVSHCVIRVKYAIIHTSVNVAPKEETLARC